MIKGKNYCYGKTHKERTNYIAPFCTKAVECNKKRCQDCILLNGTRTGFKRK